MGFELESATIFIDSANHMVILKDGSYRNTSVLLSPFLAPDGYASSIASWTCHYYTKRVIQTRRERMGRTTNPYAATMPNAKLAAWVASKPSMSDFQPGLLVISGKESQAYISCSI